MLRQGTIAPGLIGAALAGLLDGIVLHQILQWHHLICVEAHCRTKSIEILERQNFQDGVFHAAMLGLLIVGVATFVSQSSRGVRTVARSFWGCVLAGAGLFNILEGVIDHHLLQIHHVRLGADHAAWDIGFLVVSAGLVLVGVRLARSGQCPK